MIYMKHNLKPSEIDSPRAPSGQPDNVTRTPGGRDTTNVTGRRDIPLRS